MKHFEEDTDETEIRHNCDLIMSAMRRQSRRLLATGHAAVVLICLRQALASP